MLVPNQIRANLERLKTVDPEKKVFGIGMSKTGTTSLEAVLSQLGYRVCNGHWNNNLTNYLCACYKHNDVDEILNTTRYFDAFADAPWGGTKLYERLSQLYPKSYFVLTQRESNDWYRSFEKMFLMFDENPETALATMRAAGAYGSYIFFRKIFGIKNLKDAKQLILQQYFKYTSEVVGYFARRPELNFLQIDITQDPLALEKLLVFLGMQSKVTVNMPDGTQRAFAEIQGQALLRFPHVNKAPE